MLRYLAWYAVGVTFVLLTQWCAVGIVDLTKTILDQVVNMEAQGLASTEAQASMRDALLQMVGLAAGLFLFRVLSRFFIFTPGRLVEWHIRNDYFSRLLHAKREFLRQFEAGDLISRCSNDIGYVRAAFGFGGLQIANVLATFGFGFWAMWQLDRFTTVTILVPMALSLVLIQASIHLVLQYWKSANEQLGDISGLVLAALRGIAAVRSFNAGTGVLGRFESLTENYLETNLNIAKYRTFAMPLVQFTGQLSIFMVLFFLGKAVIEGDHSLGEIAAFLGYSAMVMPPLLSLGWMMNVFQRAIPAMERLQEIVGGGGEVRPNPPSELQHHHTSTKPMLKVDEVTIVLTPAQKAQGAPFVVGPVSFSLHPGKVIGLVGPIGSGKSTLLEALLGFESISSGSLSLNGENVDPGSPSFRRWVAHVPQQAFLFSDAIGENLNLAKGQQEGSFDEPRLEEVLAQAVFSLDPDVFPQGLNTEVGEKGILLSGGQRQRLAFARALLKEAPFLFLDDVLSAVDHETEFLLLQTIKQWATQAGILLATHRLSAVQWCEEILVFDQGRIAQRGTHAELIQQEGYYRDVFLQQSEESEAIAK